MKYILRPLGLATAILALTVLLVVAQIAPASPPSPSVTGVPGAADLPAPGTPMPPQEKHIDGPVKRVDPADKTVQVGWFLGLFTTTLDVTDDTHIVVGETKASLLEIREGDKVKASYETRDGKNIAKAIVVTPAEALFPPSGRTAPIQ